MYARLVLEEDHARYLSYTKILQCHLIVTQGDSGGPLTIVNEEGSHILVGIVSKRLGESCSQQDYAVFTNVSTLLPWIESSIKENGGMASCSFNFSAPPTLGISPSIFNQKTKNIVLRNIKGASLSTWSSLTGWPIKGRPSQLH